MDRAQYINPARRRPARIASSTGARLASPGGARAASSRATRPRPVARRTTGRPGATASMRPRVEAEQRGHAQAQLVAAEPLRAAQVEEPAGPAAEQGRERVRHRLGVDRRAVLVGEQAERASLAQRPGDRLAADGCGPCTRPRTSATRTTAAPGQSRQDGLLARAAWCGRRRTSGRAGSSSRQNGRSPENTRSVESAIRRTPRAAHARASASAGVRRSGARPRGRARTRRRRPAPRSARPRAHRVRSSAPCDRAGSSERRAAIVGSAGWRGAAATHAGRDRKRGASSTASRPPRRPPAPGDQGRPRVRRRGDRPDVDTLRDRP